MNLNMEKRTKKFEDPGNEYQYNIDIELSKAIRYHQSGNLGQAEELYNKILADDPHHPDALHLLGVVAYQVGKADIAVQLMIKAIEKDSNQPLYYSNLGNALRDLGNLDDAIASYQEALRIKPDLAEAHYNLGNAFHEQRLPEDAIASYQTALRIKPDYVEAHSNLGNTLIEQGELDDAMASYQKALSINPELSEVQYNLGNAFYEQRKLDDAVASYQKALRIEPGYAEAHNNLGSALKEQGKLDDAMASYESALGIKPDFAEAHNNIGNALMDQGELDDAIKFYEKTLSIDPEFAEAYNNLGNALHEQGKPDEAITAYQNALRIRPDFAEAHHHLANVTQHTEYKEQIQEMLALYRDPHITDSQKMHLAFGLGKAFEDLGNSEESFDFILEGNRLRRSKYTYDILEDRELFKALKHVFSDRMLKKKTGCGDDTPIFIIGMLRSGSSLLEQILASHPQVYGGGELEDLKQIVIHFSEKLTGNKFPNGVAKLSSENLERLGDDYIRRVRRYSDRAKYVTDKMLTNFRYVGMIRLILPNAKIIHCKRDPMDTCLSIFQKSFTGVHKYAYNLVELGEYYKLYQELMQDWHSIMPGYIFDIQYEDIVRDQEGETRKLLAYCDLPWNEACLSFHQTIRPVRTASASQVRQPIYNNSVKRWKRYEKQLGTLFDILKRK